MSQATTIPGGNPLPSAFDSSHVSTGPIAGRATTHSHPITNPLWVIVIGMGCFFGVAALVLAWS
jgi:hypothetical protein